MASASSTVEKVTFNMPKDLKQDLVRLKNEMQVSLSTIYKNALIEYVKKQELKKWENGVIKASKNKDYIAQSKSLAEGGAELYEY